MNKGKYPKRPVLKKFGTNSGIAGVRYIKDVYEPTGSICESFIVTYNEYYKNGKKKRRCTKYVSVKQHGKDKAFKIAKHIRFEAEKKIREMFPPPPPKPKYKFKNRKLETRCQETGVTGAHLSIIRKPSGYTHRAYRATYIDPDTQKKVIKVFPVCKFGEKKAKAFAIKARLEAVKKLKKQAELIALKGT